MERYRIVYTNTAADDIAEKFQYIVKVLRDRTTAERWYSRLKESIQQDNVIKLSRKRGGSGGQKRVFRSLTVALFFTHSVKPIIFCEPFVKNCCGLLTFLEIPAILILTPR